MKKLGFIVDICFVHYEFGGFIMVVWNVDILSCVQFGFELWNDKWND